MRITKKLLNERVNCLNEHGAKLSIYSANGWYNVASADGKRSYFTGSAAECYNFLSGVFAVMYQDIRFSA